MPESHTRGSLLVLLATVAAGQACSSKYVSDGKGPGASSEVGAPGATGTGGAGSSSTAGGAGGGSGGAGAGGSGGNPPCLAPAGMVKRYGDAADQVGLSVAADASGNIVVAGVFKGSLDLGGGPLAWGGSGYSLYVAKLDASGHHLWSHAYQGGTGLVFGSDLPFATVAVAPSGNVLFGGQFSGTVDFGAGPVSAVSTAGDAFIVSFDPDGHPLWSAHYGDPPPDPQNPMPVRPHTIESLAVDPAGNVLAVGYRYVGAWGRMSLYKLDPTGTPIWTKHVSATGTEEATVRVDGAGDVIVAGLAHDPIDFGGGALPTSPALPTFFRAKLDAAGNHLWSHGVLVSGFSLHPGNGAGVDPGGNVLVAGGGGDLTFDVGCGLASLGWGNKIMEFDAVSGNCVWMWGFPGLGAALAVDPAGRPIAAGKAADRMVACPDSGAGLPASACDHAFTQNGPSVEVHGLTTDPSGRVLMTGAFEGTLDFQDDPAAAVHSAGLRDAFVAVF